MLCDMRDGYQLKIISNNIGKNFMIFTFYLVLSTISLESHYNFDLSRLISFVALGHSSVDRVVNYKIQN